MYRTSEAAQSEPADDTWLGLDQRKHVGNYGDNPQLRRERPKHG